VESGCDSGDGARGGSVRDRSTGLRRRRSRQPVDGRWSSLNLPVLRAAKSVIKSPAESLISSVITARSRSGQAMDPESSLLPPLAVANMREGDEVSLDVLVTPRR
jgi:hypothetical protein